jgi:hypothetical protein
MTPETDAREDSGVRAGILLRSERFDEITAALGCTTELARAHLLGVDPKTIYLARRGTIGEKFIALVLDAFTRHADRLAVAGIEPTFEEVFEVGEKAKAAAA